MRLRPDKAAAARDGPCRDASQAAISRQSSLLISSRPPGAAAVSAASEPPRDTDAAGAAGLANAAAIEPIPATPLLANAATHHCELVDSRALVPLNARRDRLWTPVPRSIRTTCPCQTRCWQGLFFSCHRHIPPTTMPAAEALRRVPPARRHGHDALRMLCRRFSCCVTASIASIDCRASLRLNVGARIDGIRPRS